MGRRRQRGPRVLEGVRIDKLSHEGRGIGRVDGKTVFVFGALPGELVNARVLRRRGQFDEAEVSEILEPAASRIAPRCAHFGICGGCAMQHLGEADQLAHKESVLLELLQREGGVTPDRVRAPLTGPQWGYRRKARLGVKLVPKKGGVIVGFRERGKPYVTDAHECPVLDPRVGERLADLRALVQGLSQPARVPQIEVACADDVAAINLRHLEPLDADDRDHLCAFEERSGLEVYLQPGGLDSIAAVSPAASALSYSVDDLRFEFRPQDFTQVNAAINAKLVAAAVAALEPAADDRIADLFCGIGNFSLPLARRAGHVIGLEGDPALTARAAANATANAIDNASFAHADLAVAGSMSDPALAGCNKLLLDPPRSGAAAVVDSEFVDRVSRIVYVSCDAASFARDAARLAARGLHLVETGVADMFPQTAHVESLSLFARS